MEVVVAACDLEVDVNGEETFFVDKKILSTYSGRLNRLFAKHLVMAATKSPKVILHDLPGGPETFELLTRFCYDNGKIQLTPTNTCRLRCAAHFMEMGSSSLIQATEKSLARVSYWTWSEILIALRQCQDFLLIASSSGVLEKLVDSLVVRIASPTDASPSSSSSESLGLRFSFDTRSTTSTKNGHQRTWWFEDLARFGCPLIEKAVRIMISRKLDHVTISRFLLYYLKFRNATPKEKTKATETVVDILSSLGRGSVSCRSLFGILRASSSRNINKCCRSKLETMIGVQIDQATLDDLLVPARTGTESLYDVDLVFRLLKFFLSRIGKEAIPRLKRVGSLMDSYLAEVAPDSGLKPIKFVALAAALPDVARDSHDSMYRAIDMYLEVHAQLSDEEKRKICCAINYKKLSTECCKHLADNTKFPLRSGIQALLSQQSKLKGLLKDTNNLKSSGEEKQDTDSREQMIIYAKKHLDLTEENVTLRADLAGMQWRVLELERAFRKMQARMTKAKASRNGGSRSLPKLCS